MGRTMLCQILHMWGAATIMVNKACMQHAYYSIYPPQQKAT